MNDQVFKLSRDILIDVAVAGQERLAELLIELREAGLLRWRAEYSAAMLAQFFYDAARGVSE